MPICQTHRVSFSFGMACPDCVESAERNRYRGMQTPIARIGSWKGRPAHPHTPPPTAVEAGSKTADTE